MTTALVNARVLQGAQFVEGLAVLLDGPRIVEVLAHDDPRVRAGAVHDLAGRMLAPGFIDCQVNGGGGVLFNDTPDVDTIRRMAAAHRRFGTTGMLPTLISDTPAKMRAATAGIAAAMAQAVPGILGLHLEGPFLSKLRHGIHAASMIRAPDAHDVRLLQGARAGVVLVTLAPENVSLAMLRELAAHGVVLAAGHSAADYAQTRAALDAGLRGFTHLFNAMPAMQNRAPGIVGAALEDAQSWCGVIVDGHHVHAATLRVALAAKPRGKIFLVTDAMPPVGTDLTHFRLHGEPITCRDGLCVNANGTLAGSALDMATAVRNTVEMLRVPLAEAARMASEYPAAFLGIGDRRGRIAAGCAADLVAFDERVAVHATWIGGECESYA
jgi:N-acetylglucosamine-6-phosphate deacetylase